MPTKPLIPWMVCALLLAPLVAPCYARVPAPPAVEMSASDLRCEYRTDPLGIDAVRPRLQWIVESARRGERQTAYQILVASSPAWLSQSKGDVWNSGKVVSDQTAQVAYEGRRLSSGEACLWKVRVWDGAGRVSAWSAPARWSMGLLHPSDWKARWIGYDAAYDAPAQADAGAHGWNLGGLPWVSAASGPDHTAHFRKAFTVPTDRKVRHAVFVLSCDNEGAGEVNGVSVGSAVRWEKTALLEATGAVHPGENLLAVTVHNTDFLSPAAVGKLVVAFDSGADLIVPLDGTWKAFGQAPPGWDRAGFDDKSWAAPTTGGTPWGTGALADTLRTPVPYLRRTFTLTKPVTRATVYVTALGLYELHLNGHHVGHDVLNPGWTDFRKRVNYQTYDVTPLVRQGRNALGALLGDGWYAGCLAFTGRRNWYGGRPRLLAQLVVEHPDGTSETVGTDDRWKARFGPIRQADLLLGGVYDGRERLTGWDLPEYRETAWAPVATSGGTADASGTDETARLRSQIVDDNLSLVVTNDAMGGDPAYNVVKRLRVTYRTGGVEKTTDIAEKGTLTLTGGGKPLQVVRAVYGPADAGHPAPALVLEAEQAEPAREIQTLPTVKLTEPRPGCYTFDLGQNMVGWTRLRVSGTPGQKITVRHGEMLNPDGTVYTANLRSASGADIYYLSGHGLETLEPVFTLKGFRYVEVRGLTSRPSPATVTGVVVSSDMRRTGNFACSNPLVNQLYHNIIWGQKGNYVEAPTDCPQRDERAGWTGDTEFFMRTGAYNYDVASFFTRWLVTMCEDSQFPDGSFAHVAPDLGLGSGATAWGDAALQCTYHEYRAYGDTRIIQDHYAAMSRYMGFLASRSTDGIAHVGGFEDWLNLGGGASEPVVDTAYYAYLAGIMAEMAQAIGRTDDARRYARLHEDVKSAFDSSFVGTDGTLKDSSQTGYALAFTMGLVPPAQSEQTSARFAEQIARFHDHLATGFIGTPRLLPGLHAAGRDDLAYTLLLQDTYPSWLYQVKLGATTMWERWDGWTPDRGFQSIGMNSFNHYAFGAVGEYLYSAVAGIDTDGPGYKRIRIHPVVGGGLTWARASYRSIHGLIASRWRRDGQKLTLDVTIPTNTTATVYVPAREAASVTESGHPVSEAAGVSRIGAQPGYVLFAVGSGSYHFGSVLPQ